MNKEELIGNWNVLKGKIKEEWSEITDDELLNIEGKKDQMLGVIQKKYGYTREQAEKQFNKFEKEYSDACCNKDSTCN